MKKESLQKYLPPVIFFLCGAIFLFWRAPFGYCWQDEPFLASLASRILRGDTLLIDEWHGAQNTGVLILPVYALLHRILGGTEGILYAMRMVYCLSWLAALIFLWKKLEPVGNSRYAAVLYLLLFSPLDYMTLSYTSISLMCVVAIAAITYADALNVKGSPVKIGLTLGLLMTVSTLCYPHMALLFILAVLLLVGAAIYFKRKGSDRHIYYSRILLSMLAAVAFFAAAYLVCILVGKGDRPLLENIAEIFNDPQHYSKNAIDAVIQICWFIGIQGVGAIYPVGMLLLTGIALLFSKLLKRKNVFRPILLILGALLYIYSIIPLFISSKLQLNEQMRNIAFLGLLAYALTDNKPRKLFYSFYGVSAVYTYAVFMGSNTQIQAISMGMSVAGAAAVIIILMLCRELAGDGVGAAQKAAAVIAVLAVAVQIGVEIRVRLDYTYYDDTLSALTETLDRGPAKGLRTSGENKAEYDELLASFDSLTAGMELDGKTLLSASEIISLYADMDFDTYSTWLRGMSTKQMWERQEKYFALNGRELPDLIFFDEYTPYDIDIPGYEVYEEGNSTLLVKNEEL